MWILGTIGRRPVPAPPGAWALDLWERHLLTSVSTGTAGLRLSHLRRFAAEHPRPAKVSRADVEDWLVALRSREYAHSVRSSLRAYFGWAVAAGRLSRDPTAGVRTRPVLVGPGRPCDEHTLAKALRRARADGDEDLVLMLLLGSDCALRRAEIASLRTDAVSRDGRTLSIVGKGGKWRPVPLTPEIRVLIAKRDAGYVFPGRFGGHLEPGTVGKRVSAVLGGATLHQLRHRAASTFYAATGDIVATSRVLGHSSVATTQRYLGATDEDTITDWTRAMASAQRARRRHLRAT